MTDLPPLLQESFELMEALPGDKPLECFHVRSKRNGQPEYVLRILSPDLTGDRELVAQFHQFFQRYQRIGRPGLPRCHSVEIRGDTVYTVEEFIKGRTLFQYVQESPLESGVAIMDQICDALHFAHLQDVFHLCITPSDIIVDLNKATLVGFGAPVFLKDPIVKNISESCRRFIAPESLSRSEFIAASDVFSLACTIRECWPQLASNPILLKALEPDSKDRFQNSRLFQARLRDLFRPDLAEAGSKPRVPVLKLLIKTIPEAARVKVDGRLVGTTTADGVLVPWKAESVILVEKDGYEQQKLHWNTPPSEREIQVVLQASVSPETEAHADHGTQEDLFASAISDRLAPKRVQAITPFRLVVLAACIVLVIGLGRLVWFLISPPEPVPTKLVAGPPEAPTVRHQDRVDQPSTFRKTQDSPDTDLARSPTARWKKLLGEGQDLYKQARYSQAETLVRQALETSERTSGQDSINSASCCDALGLVCLEQARFDEAETLFRRALSTREQLLGPNHQEVARSLHNIGNALKGKGAYGEAETYFKRALGIREQASEKSVPDLAQSLTDLGVIYTIQRRYAEAEQSLRRAIDLSESAASKDQSELARSLGQLALVFRLQRKHFEAESLCKRALKLRERTLGPDHPETASSLTTLGALYVDLGNYAAGEELLNRALSIRERVLGSNHPDVGLALATIGELNKGRGDLVAAESNCRRALAIVEKALGRDHPSVAARMSALALLYYSQKKYAEAKPLWERSLAILERVHGPQHPDVLTLRKNLKHLAKQKNQ